MTPPGAGARVERVLLRGLAAAGLLTGTVVCASTLIFLVEDHFAGPVRDFWAFLPTLEHFASGGRDLDALVRPYGAHRLLLPRLLYLTEYELFDGSNAFLVAVGVALQVALAGLLACAVWSERARIGVATTAFGWGLIATLAFSSTQLENFVRPWNVHWFLANTSAGLAIAAGVRASDGAHGRAGWGWGLATSVAAWSASYSMATGLVVWPVLLLLGIARRARPGWLTLLAAQAALAATSYLVGNAAVGAGALSEASPGALAAWLLACIGSPLSWQSRESGIAVGLAATLAGAFLGLRVLSRRTSATRGETLLAGLLAYSFGAALLVTAGRAVRWPESWSEARYQSIVLLFWSSLILLALLAPSGEQRGQRSLRALVCVSALAWLAGVILPAHLREAESVGRFAAKVRAANLALLVGVADRRAYAFVQSFQDRKRGLDRTLAHREFLRTHRLGVFADPLGDLLGRRLEEVAPVVDRSRCRGAVLRADSVPLLQGDGLRLGGWAWDLEASRAPALLLVTGSDGVVVGLALPLRPRLLPGATAGPKGAAWIGYARDAAGAPAVWARLASGELCPVDDATASMRGP